jgi:8-oxo-dGTP diphosphatase
VTVVVGAAIVRDQHVLAARRVAPPELAGRWEFPGGKVEPDESEADALARECREELGVDVRVGELIGKAPITDGVELAVYAAEPTNGDPKARHDHDELRWLAAANLGDVAWLDVDRVFLPAIGRLLTRAL